MENYDSNNQNEEYSGEIENILGCIFWRQKDYEKMSKHFFGAIKKGNINAMINLGKYYYYSNKKSD